ncbi:hypothetical protein BDV37DRAFT_257563 [Aspergillus pseudonomiae]|uniref:Uncharacterized protein n=1 Tax=Aspergillus pseudonomiae TaxID=1506151 RepID=A0A5N7D216_9EURO|nr:uncharacterized protein BDV37DRAFT_257563 [Aspergillus pseudonomiae]KAE8400455.1 hypothetical protein BDV37DRAFT_257563 [Aspergillus pseudonomiae]
MNLDAKSYVEFHGGCVRALLADDVVLPYFMTDLYVLYYMHVFFATLGRQSQTQNAVTRHEGVI